MTNYFMHFIYVNKYAYAQFVGFVFINIKTQFGTKLNKYSASIFLIIGRVINVEIAKRNEPHEPTPGEYKGVQNMLKRYPMRHDYYGRRYDPHFDRRKYDSRRPNPYNRDYGKGYGYRNTSFRQYDKYNRNSYEHRHYDRRSIDNKYHKKGDYYKRRSKSSDDEKRYSRDDSRRRKRYDRTRKSTSVSGSERHYRNSSIDR
ncbi:hypothetical protein [Plasmodium yoelii yoelii]|nr:hypothetical protein [Plasmodium yoelii yoelii]